MSIFTKLKYLWPSRHQAEERDMREELESLKDLAEPGELGNLTLAAENARESWSVMWLERLLQDLRYAGRSMIHNKAFTALAVLSLGLGIGANTAIYSFTEAILLRSLPVSDPRSLIVMKWRAEGGYTSAASTGFTMSTGGTSSDPKMGTLGSQFPYPALELFERNTTVLSSAFGYFVADRLNVTTDDETEVVKGQYVTGDYFRGMGVRSAAGRMILATDDAAGAEAVAVLSHRFSQRRFGDVGAAIGRTIRINDQPFTVVGVAPPGFFGAEPGSVPDVYMPMHIRMTRSEAGAAARVGAEYLDPNYYWLEVMGRLAPGVGLTQAQAVLGPQFRHFAEASAKADRRRTGLPELTIVDGSAGLDSIRRRYARPVYVLMVMAGLILLIACGNVAGLLLARAAARRREIAVRLSIGASRMRVVRQLLTESVLLSSLGGLLGLACAWWGIRLLTVLLANGRDNFTLHAELNWHVLGATLALSVATGLLFGLAPATQATRVDVIAALKEVRTGTLATTARRVWSRVSLNQALVVAQIALSLVLLVAAGLFGGTLANLHAIELGFNRHDVLLFTIMPRGAAYDAPARTRLYGELQERLRHAPGVRSVSLSTRPLPAGGGTMSLVTVAGTPPLPPSPPGQRAANSAGVFTIGPAFFQTMQIPIVAGREFDERDTMGATPVAIINQKLARNLGLTNPLGARVTMREAAMFEVVGVSGDALFLFLKEELRPMIYFPYLQSTGSPSQMTFEVRTAGNASSLTNTVRQIVREIDPRLAISDAKTQATHIDQGISQEIALARLSMAFAALALVIACVGLYGTVSFNVSRRTSEIGIRMALGAQRWGIVWLVFRSVVALELLGLAVGIPIVLAGARSIESLMFGITPKDPMAIATAAGILVVAGLAASYGPAKHASTIDPMIAVRHE
jgi:predicted permease